MDIKTQLMQKHGIVTMKLAIEFMTFKVGDRIDTVANYSKRFNSARGTVQSALKLLEEYRAIRLEPRGHLGTFINYIDYKVLWQFTDIGTIMGAMPLPYSKLYEGLATGLYKVMDEKNIPFSLAYMRGAESRIKALDTGRYDFIILSKLAAEYSINNGIEMDIAVEFNNKSYLNEHVVIFAEPNCNTIREGMRIAIDSGSIDHKVMTLNLCNGKNVIYVELPYNQIISKLISKEIDAAIWNIDEIIERKLKLKYYSLNNDKFRGEDTIAVIVVNKNSYGIKNLLSQFIDMEQVLKYQKQVIEGEIVPSY